MDAERTLGQCEECGTRLYHAGEHVPEGTYLRVDDGSFERVSSSDYDVLPASFDGHVALYRAAAAPCACDHAACRLQEAPITEQAV